MTQAARYAYVGLAWAFVGGLLLQVFFIGLGLFADSRSVALHVNFGWILHMIPLLILLAAALSRAGGRHWQWALALAAVVFVIPILALFRADMPFVAALHPVGALVAFWLAVVVARNSLGAVRTLSSVTDLSRTSPHGPEGASG